MFRLLAALLVIFLLCLSIFGSLQNKRYKITQTDVKTKATKEKAIKQTNEQKTMIFHKEMTVDKIFGVCLFERVRAPEKWWSKTVVFMSINAIINYLITNLSFSRAEKEFPCAVLRNGWRFWNILVARFGSAQLCTSTSTLKYQFKWMQIHLLCVVPIDLPFSEA